MCSSIDSSLIWSFKDFIGVVFFGVLSKLFILRLWSGDNISNDFEAIEVILEPLAGVLLEGLAWSSWKWEKKSWNFRFYEISDLTKNSVTWAACNKSCSSWSSSGIIFREIVIASFFGHFRLSTRKKRKMTTFRLNLI